jgi:hypothetical protein
VEAPAGEKKEEEPQPAEETAPVDEAGAETPCAFALEDKKEEEPPVDKIGEVNGVVATEVTQASNPRFLFRVIYKKKTDEGPLTLEESLKPNDKIKVTIIRTLKAPEPEAAPAQG